MSAHFSCLFKGLLFYESRPCGLEYKSGRMVGRLVAMPTYPHMMWPNHNHIHTIREEKACQAVEGKQK